MLNVHVIVVAYALTHELGALKASVQSQHQVSWHLFLHSRFPEVVSQCEKLAKEPTVTFYPYGTNRGLSKSWNQGLIRAFNQGADTVILVNDDCLFSPGDFDKLVEYSFVNRETFYMISAMGFDRRLEQRKSLGLSCSAINLQALERVGCFDENFFPAYYEDCDYTRRAELLGLKKAVCTDTQIHHSGSASIFADAALTKQFEVTFATNQTYYIRKWGGDLGKEQFIYPFNDPAIRYDIPFSVRSAPYGPRFDRVDWHLVRY